MIPPSFDAILIPGGGLTADGQVPPWVQARLDRAIQRHRGEPILVLSAGTTHKPPPLDKDGFPIFETRAAAAYLQGKGIHPDLLFTETSSYDTIGNAYFAHVVHTGPRGWRRLLVITSDFHAARTQAVFEWIFMLDAPAKEYHLAFETVPNIGLSQQALAAREEKESRSLMILQTEIIPHIQSLAELHHWLYTEHGAYAAGAAPRKDDGEVVVSY